MAKELSTVQTSEVCVTMTERLIKKVEQYLYENYEQRVAPSQQWVLRRENGTIRRVSEMAVESLKEDLKTTPD